MKFKITKHTRAKKINIFGKVIDSENEYIIDCYKWELLGIIPILSHRALRFWIPYDGVAINFSTKLINARDVMIEFTEPARGNIFPSKEDAIQVVNDIKNNPDKYWIRLL